MPEVNFLGILVSTILAFVASFIYYIAFAKERRKLSPAAADSKRPNPKLILSELGKNLVISFVVGLFVHRLGLSNLTGAINFSFIIWIGFPVMILLSSVMYEKVPWKLAAIHAGDWLLKLLIITIVLMLLS
jgi:hypothetical protein